MEGGEKKLFFSGWSLAGMKTLLTFAARFSGIGG